MWENWNQVLHHEQRGLDLLGLTSIDDEIIEEHARGIDAYIIDN